MKGYYPVESYKDYTHRIEATYKERLRELITNHQRTSEMILKLKNMKLQQKKCKCTKQLFTNTYEKGKEVWICTECYKSVLKSKCLDKKPQTT